MKTLSAFNTTAIDSPVIDIVVLFKIEFSGLTLYLCDRVFGTDDLCVFDSIVWEPLIFDYSTIESGAIDPVSYSVVPGSAEITIDNNSGVGGASRFSALFSSYDPHYTTITISTLFIGAAAEIPIFKGQIENIRGMTTDQITLVCSSFELDLANKFPITVCTTDDYAGADPDDVGKMIPKIWGQARKVPAVAVDAGGKSTIAEDMTAAAPGNGGTLDISNGAVYPAGAFIFQTDSEQISIASRAGNVLTLAGAGARAYGGTTATAHDAGAPCAEIQTNYFYMVADHPVKAIDAVYVDNILVTAGFVAYTGQAGDHDPSGLYDGKAVINFSALPTFAKQVNLTASDDLAVYAGTLDTDAGSLDGDASGQSMDEGSHAHGSYGYIQYFSEGWQNNSGVGTPDDAVGYSLAEFAFFNDTTDYCEWNFNTTKDAGGSPYQIKIGFWYLCSGGNNTTVIANFKDSGGTTLVSVTGTAGTSSIDDKVSAWADCSSKTWAQISGGKFVLDVVSWDGQWNVYAMWIEVQFTPDSSAATGVDFTGNPAITGVPNLTGDPEITGSVSVIGNSTAETVIGKMIAADVDGYQDDGAGTYTGTPSALIERPGHILHHMIVVVGGLAAGDLDLAGTYTTSDVLFVSGSYALAVVVLQRPNFRDLINRIAYQSKSIEFWEAGVHHLICLPATETTDKTIESHRIDLKQLWVKYTDRVDILNSFTARYARDWSGHSDNISYSAGEIADRAVVGAVTDAASIVKYGTLEIEADSFPYVTTAAQATLILNWKADDLADPRLIVEFSGGFYLSDLERGDIITFTEKTEAPVITSGRLVQEDGSAILLEDGSNLLWEEKTQPADTALTDAFAGLVTMDSDQFRIIDVSRGKDEIFIQCVMID